MSTYDLAVIGGGTAGLVASAAAAGIGARVALIESDRLGGECLWTGCVPSKAMIAAARAASNTRSAGRFGVLAGDPQIDFSAAMSWVREAQARIAPHDSPERFRSLGVDVIEGRGRFVGRGRLAVNGHTLEAKRIVIATGSRPLVPPITGLESTPHHTNETIFELTQLPRTLMILGAGPIGLELAQAFARLGSSVTVIEAEERLLPREDMELATLLGELLAAEGIRILLGHRAESASPDGTGARLRVITAAGEELSLRGDVLLVATGRKPNLEGLDAREGGVESSKNGVIVDERLRTTAERVWASGDVTGGPRFTHVADYQSRLVIRNAFAPLSGKADYGSIPWVTYTDPELAHVGLTEEEARERHGGGVSVWRQPFARLDRAITDGATEGWVKIITGKRGRILGGHILGHGAGDLIGEIALAMKHGLGVGKLATTVRPYPTYSEATRQAAEQYYKARFTGVVKSVARWFARR